MGYQPPPPPGGYPPPPPPPGGYPPAVTTGDAPSANKALIAGILSVTCCGIIAGILAIIWGNATKNEISSSGGMLGGSGKGTAAVVLGWISIAYTIVWVIVALTGGFNFQVGS